MLIRVRTSDYNTAYINSKKIQSIEIESIRPVDSDKTAYYIAFYLENRKYYHVERWFDQSEAEKVLEYTAEYVEEDE